jgi:hypothetical protein
MTRLTIELTPDIYVRLQAEAQRQGRAEQDVAQELLTRQLATAQSEMPLYVSMLPRIRALVAGMNPGDFSVPGTATPEEAIALLRSWSEHDATTADDDEAGVGTWEDVMRAIDANRTSYRKLFPDLEQPE